MNRDTWLQYFQAAAEPVQFYLLDEASGLAEDTAREQLKYEHDAWDRVMDLIWDAVFVKTSLMKFQNGIKAIAGTRDVLEVERVLSLELLYPLADMLSWDLDLRLQQLGISATAYHNRRRISLRPMSYGAAVRRIAAEARISLLGEDVVRRLRDIFVSYVKRIRTSEQVLEILHRSSAGEGMGWSVDQAQAFITAADAALKQVPVMSEEEYSRWLQQVQREAESEDIRKITEQKQKAATAFLSESTDAVPAVDRRPMNTAAMSVLERGVEETFALVNVPGLDEYLTKRLRNVISTRLRGVRNAVQATEVLARDNKVGGLGQTPEEVARISAVIEHMYAEYHEKIELDERTKVEGFVQEQQKRIDERKELEGKEREQWYQQKMQAVALGETGAVSALRAMMSGVRMVGPTCDISPAGTVQVSLEGSGAMSGQVDGVQGLVRLSSLTEQLESMDIARFRRLAKTPDEAKKKILQMLHALKQESYDRGMEGVKRWRQSPLQQEYLKLVTQAFTDQRPVTEIAELLRQTNKEGLTPEEVGVIIDLNQEFVF